MSAHTGVPAIKTQRPRPGQPPAECWGQTLVKPFVECLQNRLVALNWVTSWPTTFPWRPETNFTFSALWELSFSLLKVISDCLVGTNTHFHSFVCFAFVFYDWLWPGVSNAGLGAALCGNRCWVQVTRRTESYRYIWYILIVSWLMMELSQLLHSNKHMGFVLTYTPCIHIEVLETNRLKLAF